MLSVQTNGQHENADLINPVEEELPNQGQPEINLHVEDEDNGHLGENLHVENVKKKFARKRNLLPLSQAEVKTPGRLRSGKLRSTQ